MGHYAKVVQLEPLPPILIWLRAYPVLEGIILQLAQAPAQHVEPIHILWVLDRRPARRAQQGRVKQGMQAVCRPPALVERVMHFMVQIQVYVPI